MPDHGKTQQPPFPGWVGYALTVVLEGVLTLGLRALQPHFPLGQFPISYILLVMAVAYLFGVGPAILAVAIGLLLFDYYFIPPLYTLPTHPKAAQEWASLTAFLIGAFIVGVATTFIRRARINAQRLAEERLGSGERITNILESITDAFFTVDREWRFTYMNSEAERLLQRTKNELMGRNVWEEFAPSVGSTFYNEYHRAAAEGITVEFEEYYEPLSSWYDVRAYPSAEGLSVYFRDITARRQAELIIEETKRINEMLLDSLPHPAMLLRRDRTILAANRISREFGAKNGGLCWREFGKAEYVPEECKRHLKEHPTEIPAPGIHCTFCLADEGLTSEKPTNCEVNAFGRLWDTWWIPIEEDIYLHYAIDITERKKAQAAVEESERRFRTVFDNAGDAIFVHDMEGNFLDVNQAAAERLGYTRDELLHMNVRDIDTPEYAARLVEGVEALRQKGHMIAETCHVRRDGTLIPTELSARIIEYDGMPAILSTARDITERKRSQAALEESERRFHTLAQVSPVGIFQTDSEGNCVYVNERWIEITGVTLEEALGEGWVRGLHPEDREHVAEEWYRAAKERQPFRSEYRFQRPNGTITWVLGQALAERADGEIVGYVGTITDINDRKNAEMEVQESRERLSRILGTIPSGILMVEVNGKIRVANSSAQTVLGTKRSEIVGRLHNEPEWRLMTPEGEPLPEEDLPFNRVMQTGKALHDLEYCVRKPDGGLVTLSINATPSRGPTGNLIGVVLSLTDVTEQVSLRKTLNHQLTSLQRALLPGKPSIHEDYAVAAEYLPAFEGEEIGGDFYDVFATEDGKAGILIGDVSGKGIQAASLAASTRSTVRAFAYDLSTPGEALRHTNAVLFSKRATFDSFVTAFLAILDPATGEVTYVSAGHPPGAIFRSGTGQIEFTALGTTALGLINDLQFVDATTRLEVGDKLFLYTDGISEARKAGDFFGQEGIARVLKEHGHVASDKLIEEMLSAAMDWAGGRLRDDAVVLVIERRLSTSD